MSEFFLKQVPTSACIFWGDLGRGHSDLRAVHFSPISVTDSATDSATDSVTDSATDPDPQIWL